MHFILRKEEDTLDIVHYIFNNPVGKKLVDDSLLSKLVLEFTLFCHPEPVSGSQMALFCEMLNQVQHDTGKRNLFLKNQINIKTSNKISGAFENTRPICTTV